MPNLGRILELNMYFTAKEGQPLEPVHVHLGYRPSPHNTKLWLLKDGTFKVAYQSKDMSDKKLRQSIELLELQAEYIKQAWLDFFGEISYYE